MGSQRRHPKSAQKLFCEENDIVYQAFSASEIKKSATGKGNSGKPQMIAAAKEKYGYTGTDDNEADNTITITNGGNQVYANFDITGQNATGQTFTDLINADKFSVDNLGGQTSGQVYMISNTPVDVTSKLSLNSKGASVTEQIFFYADIPSGIRADTYLSDTAWAIQLS